MVMTWLYNRNCFDCLTRRSLQNVSTISSGGFEHPLFVLSLAIVSRRCDRLTQEVQQEASTIDVWFYFLFACGACAAYVGIHVKQRVLSVQESIVASASLLVRTWF